MRAWAVAGLLLAVVGCRETSAAAPPSPALPDGAASAPVFTREAASPESPDEPDLAPASEAEGNEAEVEPTAEEAAPEELAEEPVEGAEVEPEAAPLPEVDVRNVGMHIGGEANTAEQKRPIRAEISKHYDAMRRCYGKAVAPKKTTTFGVDMRIPGDGGAAKITNPRSGLRGEGVKECLVETFEAIEFPRQPQGKPRMVSYSIEFRRK